MHIEGADNGSRLTCDLLRAGEMAFRRLLDKLPVGAYTCDPQGLITYYNPSAVRLWGRAPKLNDQSDRFCGSFKLFKSDGEPVLHNQCWMALALQGNREYNGHEIVVERPDGQRLTVLAYANPLRDDSGALIGAVNVLVDITDRKHAEDRLREADRSKDEFLATLAHELRNPLAPVRNALEILRLQPFPNDDAKWAVDLIDRQMKQMTRLIDDLLDISRVTQNKLDLRKEREDLAAVVNAAVETSRPVIEAAGHELFVNLPPNPLPLRMDATRLAQAVSNLLNNAAKYTEHGGRIWLTVERQGSDAVVSVRDSGVGIPADMLPRVFDMFVQVDRSLNRSCGGLGIGLTLVKRLVELHGGTVEARSAGAGAGCEFIIRLPIVIEPGASSVGVNAAPASDASRAVEGAVASGAARKRILVVDDNRDSARSLGLLLKVTGHNVRVAHDGLEAIALAEAFRPDVALLDIGMPRMNGYDAAQHLRQQPWARDLILIALTGWGQEGDRQRSKEAGFDHHVIKPVDLGALLQVLNSPKQAQTA